MDEYTYKDLIINPETPGLEDLIGKEVYSDNTPLGCLQRANKSYGVGILREIRKDDYRPFYVEYPNGMMLTFICIIIKKEEPKEYTPFKSADEFIDAYDCANYSVKNGTVENKLLSYGGMWLKGTVSGSYYMVAGICNNGVTLANDPYITSWAVMYTSWGELLKDYVFLDDSPCGRLVEEKHE